jgi:hypothetical protein
LQIKTKIVVSCHTAISKPVKQEYSDTSPFSIPCAKIRVTQKIILTHGNEDLRFFSRERSDIPCVNVLKIIFIGHWRAG